MQEIEYRLRSKSLILTIVSRDKEHVVEIIEAMQKTYTEEFTLEWVSNGELKTEKFTVLEDDFWS